MPTSVATFERITSANFERMAPSVDPDNLIDAYEVARMLGLSHRNTVSGYQRRYPDMPRPVVDMGKGRCKLWHRPAIVQWLKETKRECLPSE